MLASELLAALVRSNLAIGVAVLVVLGLRKLVRPAFGARVGYLLWLLPILAALAVLAPARQVVVVAPTVAVTAATSPLALPVVQTTRGGLDAPAVQSAAPLDLPRLILAVWSLGVIGAALVMIHLQRRFVAETRRGAIGPAVVGVISPRIVTPRDFANRFSDDEQALVLAHERAHIDRQDSRINGLSAVLQCLCWFNPLVHLGAHLMRIDQEMACDETVVARFPRARRVYAQALVKAQLAIRPLPLGCYWPSRAQHPLYERIAMLKREDFSRTRRLAGGAALAALCATTAAAAWAAQPTNSVSALSPVLASAVAPNAAGASPAISATAPPTSVDPVGDWMGVLTENANLRIALHITRSARGAYQGALDSPDQMGFGIPLADIKVSGATLSLTAPSIKATYQAMWDGHQWAGRWIQLDGQLNTPLDMKRGVIPPFPMVAGLDGNWSGVLTTPAGNLRLGVRILTNDHGTLASFDSPDQKAYGLPVSALSHDGTHVTIGLKLIGAKFEGALAEDGKTLVGAFSQYGSDSPLILTRGAVGAALAYPLPNARTAALPQPPIVPVQASVLAGYVGRYAVASVATLTITLEDGHLFAQLTNQAKFEIYPSGPKDFFWKVVDAQATFQVGPDGRATALTLHQNGRDAVFRRVEDAGAVIPAPPAPGIVATDLSGTWSVDGVFGSEGRIAGVVAPVCVFQQARDHLTGTCKGPNTLGVATGTVDGTKVAWQWEGVAYTPVGLSGTTTFKGEVDANGVVHGVVTSAAIPGQTGAFTAQRR